MALTRKDFARHSRPVLKTRRWQVLRHVILERDGCKCRCCGGRKRLEVDHVQPVRSAPARAFDPANLQVLCASCHT
ncbi:MAG: HNH endonuclease [Gemmobacter sp.]